MNDHETKVVAKLRNAAQSVYDYVSRYTADDVEDGIGLIERLSAENDRLAAEVVRLTPKPMTLGEAVRVLNERRFMGFGDWIANRHDIVIGGSSISIGIDGCPRFEASTAKMIAQGLLRDAEKGGGS